MSICYSQETKNETPGYHVNDFLMHLPESEYELMEVAEMDGGQLTCWANACSVYSY